MFKKVILGLLIFNVLFLAGPASAAPTDNTSQIPELNPFCWKRKDCEDIRVNKFGASDKDKSSGFITGPSVAPCVGKPAGGTDADEWGRCLPAGTSKTEISFGGKAEFANVGEFIVLMYKYLLTIASIVAVVVIIIAGAQWITSGGNSEAISSAKKRIGGAIIGLFIAYMSYFVLNTINPALVNLRLPQVWLVKPLALMPEFCSDIDGAKDGKIKFALVATKAEPTKLLPPAKERTYITQDNAGFTCGNRLLVENGGESTCIGSYCAEQKTCIDKTGDRKGYDCEDARIYGNIAYSSFAKTCGIIGKLVESVTDKVDHWGCPPIVDSKLVVVCENEMLTGTSVSDISSLSGFIIGSGHGEENGHYWVSASVADVETAEKQCADKGRVKGFVADFQMYVPIGPGIIFTGLIGVFRESNRNQYHLVGRNGEDLGEFTRAIKNLNKVNKQYLLTSDEVKKGIRLNVDASNIGDSSSLDAKYLQQ